jgi:small neutral amino acid transporter SnatA (MarC family)
MNTTTNQTAITVITSTIAIMAISCVISICCLAFFGIPIPPELNTLAGGLVGALTAMLVKTSPTETIKSSPAEVQVVNPPTDPVPTVEAKENLAGGFAL